MTEIPTEAGVTTEVAASETYGFDRAIRRVETLVSDEQLY